MPTTGEDYLFQVWKLDAPLRADVFVGRCLTLNRSQLKKRMEDLRCNGRQAKLSRALATGDLLAFRLRPEEPLALEPEALPLRIVYQDQHLLVVNKEQGMVVHPGDGNPRATLIQGVLHYDRQQRVFASNPLRLGLVHRLDKDTTGIVLVARDIDSLSYFSQQFALRKVEKTYLAVVRGHLPARQATVDAPLARDPRHRKRFKVVAQGAGREAQTHYRVLAQKGHYAWVELRPRTGRTHQLRCHMQHLHAPIVGDPIYSRRDPLLPDTNLLLHALSLRIQLPNGQRKTFYAPLPPQFKAAVRELILRDI